ncbi:hypothetical protein BST81_16610 [Leptolyngbya sp. 'hensonii']|uniref:hypothetical protein n=1 Tax=Leptolyngbya sp. 'hensonii' TaxID=1922337 RepID=UPI00094F768C|nr:hypothetical protein [Leptolyngbya sp. 'hensonii']OLP17414.1 hypothetical protein BST81_16610 [Leptolyngbya sp. 'hensonii']
MKTIRNSNGNLVIPVLDETGEAQPEIVLRGTVLGELFDAKLLSSLAIVKLDLKSETGPNERADLLNNMTFADGRQRIFVFNSGETLFFASPEVAPCFSQFFQTHPEAACTHGSLLTSNCYVRMQTLEQVRVRIVDYQQQPELAMTHDCYGWCSPRIAHLMDNAGNRPFQFRLGYLQEWHARQRRRNQAAQPGTSFLAKGVFLSSPNLETTGCDLLLDRSSIKGIAKAQLDLLLPCGDYLLPKLALGNRQNAIPSRYNNNWEFLCWYSPEAIRKDLVEGTRQKAMQLANLQGDPLKLKRHMIEAFREADELILSTDDLLDYNQRDSRWIRLLEADEMGHLCQSRMFVAKAQEMLQEQWRSLATKGAFRFSSGMAVPIPDLEPGCVCIPHLPEGDVLLTRYPIVSSDNIRVAENVHLGGWEHLQGICGIHPEDTGTFQSDFDGDQFICCPAERLPHIAQETLRLEDKGRFQPIIKYPKQSYLAARNHQGRAQYPTLAHVAVETNRGEMALVSSWIGRVQDSIPTPEEDPASFQVQKQELLEKLFQAMQIEVDHPKNPMKYTDLPGYENLGEAVKAWMDNHPSPFFQFYKDPELYRSGVMPTAPDRGLYVLAAAINPLWEPVRLKLPARNSVRYLAPPPKTSLLNLGEDRTQWAEDLKRWFNQASAQLRQKCHGHELNREIGRLYDTIREQIEEQFPDPEERLHRAISLWDVCHRPDDRFLERRKCIQAASRIAISLRIDEVTLPGEVDRHPRYILHVPVGNPSEAGDQATACRDYLETKGIAYHARLQANLPVIDFILHVPCPFGLDNGQDFEGNELTTLRNQLEAKQAVILAQEPNPEIRKLLTKFAYAEMFPQGSIRSLLPNRMAIHPDYTWVENPHELTSGKGALAYNVLTDEVAQLLQSYEFHEMTIVGVQYNDLKDKDFAPILDQVANFRVGRFEMAKTNPKYHRYQGQPCIQSGQKTVGVYASGGAKLPVGATFKAVIAEASPTNLRIQIIHDSIQIPQPLTDQEIRRLQQEQAQGQAETQARKSKSRSKSSQSRKLAANVAER